MAGVIREHIEIVQGAGGPKARITGHRISVQDVVIWHEKLGMSPDEIACHHPTITLADVHAALACYWETARRSSGRSRKRRLSSRSSSARTPLPSSRS